MCAGRIHQSEQKIFYHFSNNYVKFRETNERRLTNRCARRCGTSSAGAIVSEIAKTVRSSTIHGINVAQVGVKKLISLMPIP